MSSVGGFIRNNAKTNGVEPEDMNANRHGQW